MKRFLFYCLFLFVAICMHAQEVTLDFTTNNWGLPEDSSNKVTAAGIYTNDTYSITLEGGGSGGYYYNTAKYLMLGKSGASLTLPAFDFAVSKIEVVGTSGASNSVKENIYVGDVAVSTECTGGKGTNTFNILSNYQAKGNVYVFRVTSNHNAQITKINIYKATAVSGPEITPSCEFENSLTVEMSVADGAKIYYTTNGDEPTDASAEYTAPFSVNATTTVKAVAVLNGETSSVVSATYTKIEKLSIAEAREKCTTNGVSVIMDLSGAQVVGVGGSNLFVQKDNVGICLYKSNPSYKVGDIFANGSYAKGTAKLYGGLHEITSYTITGEVTNGELLPPIEVSISELDANMSCTYIKLTDKVTIDASEKTMTSAGNSLPYYDTFGYIGSSTLPTSECVVEGVISMFSNNLQILPTSILTDATAQLPEMSKPEGDVDLNSVIIITPAAGTTVKYTIDGEEYDVTENGEIALDEEGAISITVTSSQKFYTSVTKTYNYNVVVPQNVSTVKFSINGVINEENNTIIATNGELNSASLPNVELPANVELVGWTLSPNSTEKVEFPYTVASDVTLYALFAEPISYTLVTDASSLAVNDVIVIVATEYNYAMSTNQKSNNRGQVEIEKSADGNNVTPNEEVQFFTLENGTEDGTFAFNTGSGYIHSTSGDNNYLRTQTTVDANASWTIEIENGVATMKSKGTGRNWLRYNKASSLFSCYSSGQQNVSLYRKTGSDILTTSYLSVSVPDDLGYVTFCHSENVIIPDGVKAYAATAANDSYVSLEEITGVIPAGEGCLLAAAKGDYTLFVGGDASSVATNYMVGNPTAERVAVNYSDNNSYYVLVEQDGILVFGKKVSDFSVAAGKAYLCIPGMSSSASLRIGFPGTTGIYDVNVESDDSTVVYDLAGRRVNSVVESGIYIVNGKKVFINK